MGHGVQIKHSTKALERQFQFFSIVEFLGPVHTERLSLSSRLRHRKRKNKNGCVTHFQMRSQMQTRMQVLSVNRPINLHCTHI